MKHCYRTISQQGASPSSFPAPFVWLPALKNWISAGAP